MKKIFLMMLTLVMSITAWAQDPYFEIVDGSYASGKVTIKVTFPERTSVTMNPDEDWCAISLRYASTSLQYAYNRNGKITSEGNTLTIVYDDFAKKMPEGTEDRKFYLQAGPSDILIDGERPTTYMSIRPNNAQPYAEVTSGSIASGNATVKVTIPYADVVTSRNRDFYYVSLQYDGTEVTKVKGTELTTDGNTLSVSFSAFTAPSDNMRRYRVKLDNYMLDVDGASNSESIVPFKGYETCPHANITKHDAKEPTTEEAGNQAYDFCEDCGKYFLADDTEHTNPVKWSAIEIEKICTHEGYWGEDDICSHCGAIREHADRASKTWELGNIKVTYSPVARSLTISGSGAMPPFDYSKVVDKDYVTPCREQYPWYQVLDLRSEPTSWGGSTYKHDALNILTIEEGVQISSYDHSTYYLSPSVLIDHNATSATSTPVPAWSMNIIVVENEEGKKIYPEMYNIYTKAEMEAMGSFPNAALRETCRHINKIHKVPTCHAGHKNTIFEYCPTCGLYFYTEKYTYQMEDGGHKFNSAHKCSYCGKFEAGFCKHEHTTAYDAVAASDEHPGHIAFVKCNDCDQYFAAEDTEHKTPLNFTSQVLIPQTGVECSHESYTNGICDNCGAGCVHGTLSKVKPECRELGVEYVLQCDKCHLCFIDPECKTQVDASLLKHDFGHDGMSPQCLHEHCGMLNKMACEHPMEMREFSPGTPSTCYSAGIIDHFCCGLCGALFADFESMEPINEADLTAPLAEHNYHARNGVCMECGATRSGEPYPCGHATSMYGYQEYGDNRASCTDEYYTTYYYCKTCYQYFYFPYPENKNVTIEVTKPEIKITPGSKLHGGHLVNVDMTKATCTENGYYGHRECTVCGRKYPTYGEDDECTITNAISDEDFENYYKWENAHHTFAGKNISPTPDEEGLYSYICDVDGCDGLSTDKIIKGFNRDGSNLVINVYGSETKNKMVGSMKLYDDMEQYSPIDFYASNSSYTRELGKDDTWGTLCLPFNFDTSTAGEDFQFYTISKFTKYDGFTVITMSKNSGKVTAGTPAIFCRINPEAESITVSCKSDITSWSEPTALRKFITNKGLTITDVSATWYMGGTIKGCTLHAGGENNYLYQTDGEHMKVADRDVEIPHYRGWFQATGTPSNQTYFFFDENDDATRILTIGEDGNLQECADIHDLSGRKLARPQMGQINIINGKKLFVK